MSVFQDDKSLSWLLFFPVRTFIAFLCRSVIELLHQITFFLIKQRCCVETDQTFPKESRRRAEDILEEVKATYHVQIFSGVTHGFGTRGDPNVENSRMFILYILFENFLAF